MKNKVEEINNKLKEIESLFNQTKVAKFQAEEALNKLTADLNNLMGQSQALTEVRDSIQKDLEVKSSKK